MSENSYQFFPGRIKIDEIIISNGVNKADVTDLFVEMNINSFVTGDTTSIEVLLLDSANFFTKFRLRGGDNLNIKFSYNDTLKDFSVKIVSIESINNFATSKTYSLRCVSHFAFQNFHKGIIKSYKGNITEIARQIFDEYSTETDKLGHFEESSNNGTYVIPNWPVIDTLNWLASKAVWTKDEVRYRFYQDSNLRYNFAPVELGISLFKEKPAFKFSYNLVVGTNGIQQAPNSALTYSAIKSLTFEDSFNIGESLMLGDITGEIKNANITNKTYTNIDYNYFNEFDKEKHLNPFPQYKNDLYEPAKTIYDLTFSQLHNEDDFNRSVDKSKLYYSRINDSQLINIEVVGNPVVEVGTVVEIEIANADTSNPDNNRTDNNLSGLYYIIGKRDIYKRDTHDMYLTLSKESQIESIE